MTTLIGLCFISTWLLTQAYREKTTAREAIVHANILLGLFVAFTTEFLSLFNSFNRYAVLACWITYAVVSFLLILQRKEAVLPLIREVMTSIKERVQQKKNRPFFILFATVLVLLLIQGLAYPSNNYDSMTYHMSRISHWLYYESVEFYPTHNYRQLFQPPFAEYVIAHTILLHGSDLFANSVQVVYLFFTCVSLTLVAKELGFKPEMEKYVAAFGLLVPVALLQSTTTKNDVVLAFWISVCIYYTFKLLREKNPFHLVCLSACIGFSIFTKATGYIYLFPVILLITGDYLKSVVLEQSPKLLVHGVVAVVIIGAINLGHLHRNSSLSGSPLGVTPDLSSLVANEEISFEGLYSNALRNLGLHLGPYPLNIVSVKTVVSLHKLMGFQVENPAFTYKKIKFEVRKLPNKEDDAHNPLHLLLILGSCSWAFLSLVRKKKKQGLNRKTYFLYLIVVVGFLLFCGYLKWQPWNTRLCIPILMISAPLILIPWTSRLKLINVITGSMYLYGLSIILINSRSPLISVPPVTNEVNIFDSRSEKVFAGDQEKFENYQEINSLAANKPSSQVGVIIGLDTWDYPLINQFNNGVPKVYANINIANNLSTKLEQDIDGIKYIIAEKQPDSILYNGNIYRKTKDGSVLKWYELEY